jgi:hypothetical protein
MQLPYTLTSSSLTVLIKGIPKVVDKSHANFQKVIEAVLAGDEDLVLKLSDVGSAIITFGKGNVKMENGVVTFQGKELQNYAVDKLIEFMSLDLPVEPILAFLENLMENPSYRAVQELYKFLEVGQMPLTEDGHFLAYKKVKANFKDIYSGTFDNSVGKICEMPRNKVDEDSSRTCSSGLHVCSYNYLSSFGNGTTDKVVIVKINPRDVVSIPADYNNTKMRLCRYEVIQDVTAQYKSLDVLKKTTLHTVTKKNTIGQYSRNGVLLGTYASAPEAETATGVWQQNILKCCRGERATAGDFNWKFL